MRAIDGAVVLGLAALAAAGGYRVLAGRERTAPRPPVLRQVSLPVHAAWSPVAGDAAWAQTGDAGTLTLLGGDGESVVGLATAVLFEDRGDATAWHDGQDATTAQVGPMLDLRRWLRAGRAVASRYYVHIVAFVRGAEGEEWRSAWVRVRPADLHAAPLAAELAPRRRITVRCATSSGQRVPGAYVALGPAELGGSMAGIAVTTDERGEARIGGLPEDSRWALSTDLGVGPSAETTRATLDLATETTAAIEVPLSGRWSFQRVALASPFAGSALGVARPPVDDPAGPAAWYVSPLVMPGTASPALWIMRPERALAPLEITLALRGYEPERVVLGAPAREPIRLRPAAAGRERGG